MNSALAIERKYSNYMDVKLPVNLAKCYKSKSQIARVITEAWVVANISCPSCGNKLVEYPANEKSKDIYCSVCRTDFQIKSSKNRFSKKITGAEYNTTLNNVINAQNPSLMLLFYDEKTMMVVDFQIIHHSFITKKNIIPRKPLSSTAKRAGWQGCLIDIEEIPEIAKTFIVRNGVIDTSQNINKNWKISDNARKLSAESRGWLSDVMSIVDKMGNKFRLIDVYEYEQYFEKFHPNNNNIQAKIRQQLQLIRDMGIIEFIGRGEYQKTKLL